MFILYSLCANMIIYLGLFPNKGNCIQCYSCDSMTNTYCDDPFNVTAIEASICANDNFACLKREKYDKDVNRTYLYRGCIQKHFCEVLAKASDYCFTCTSDYCNSSSKHLQIYYLRRILMCIIFLHLNNKGFVYV